MRLLLCCSILVNIGRNAVLCYVCHVYSQDLNVILVPGANIIPRSVVLMYQFQATNCSFCFGVLHFNIFISGCRRNGHQESKTLNEFFGVMCSRSPTYCGYNLCCCASTNCYNELRNHFLRGILQLKRGVICDVYRQQWIGNSRSKGLNRSSYPTSEQLYRRTDCSACVSLVDEGGVEMSCAEDLGNVCRNMDLLVGGPIGENCSEALRNFYSGYQKVLGTPQMFAVLSNAHCLYSNSLIIAVCLSITVLLGQWFHSQMSSLHSPLKGKSLHPEFLSVFQL
ncbi:unnamed protein product [Brugia timori]|uniref:UPAR/Ly6 domain-containing protein n=1 Tax=Brugia timori TaxID=42155 RepID=A0A0R3QVS3_9BILA|nr:unnamed protein product [Brugia timori]